MTEPYIPKGGGEEQIRELALNCYAPLLRYAISLSKNEAIAMDAVQDSFLKLIRESERKRIEFPRAWLFRVCRNKIFDELKRGKRHSCIDGGGCAKGIANADRGPRAEAEAGDGVSRILEISEHLSDREREVVRLKFQCGFSYAQMAQIMSISENNVGVTLHKALKNLRSMFFEKTAAELKHS